MTSAKTSRPDSSGTKPLPPQAFDKLYWLRVASGIVAGYLSDTIAVTLLDPTETHLATDAWNGLVLVVFVYIISFYLGKYVLYRGLSQEYLSKLYTTGLLAYVGFFLLSSMVFFTVHFL